MPSMRRWVVALVLAVSAGDVSARPRTWSEKVLALRQGTGSAADASKYVHDVWRRLEVESPVQWDWLVQDVGSRFSDWLAGREDEALLIRMVDEVMRELDAPSETLSRERQRLAASESREDEEQWLDLYLWACRERRRMRLAPLLGRHRQIVFAKHYNMGGSHYAYTEGQSDAQRERHFHPGTALCLLELDGFWPKVETLIDDPHGVIRNPDVSYDGKRILFAWKKSDRQDDYHLYEMDVDTRAVRQLTFGLGFADYEGVYLPNGDILFNSTRCVQTVDCWWTEVSNLYRCDRDGRFLRRLTFDQVHTNYPQVLEDGRIVYTRWDYNDRGQIYPQPLFQMRPDGTGQTEFYGNNSWFPTTIAHARPIPGTQRVMAIATGHHSIQKGKLIIVDPTKGRQEAAGVQLIAPVQETEAVRVDAYGQTGDQFQYPYPLSEDEFLVCFSPDFSPDARQRYDPSRFKLYFMDATGRRELLAADEKTSCNQPVPLSPRARPALRPSGVDYRQDTGVYYVQDVYAGPGLRGVERGTIKKLRVVEIRYRPAGIGENRSNGPAGGALASTPISIDNGCWDVKVVLGEAKVYGDGSACFVVPARTPVYFQAIDAASHVAQSMRSWSTLQPGETFSCVGCHESKNETPPAKLTKTMAMHAGPQPLSLFYGPPRGFSFPREIQPILNRHCVKCHDGRQKVEGTIRAIFSLLANGNVDPRAKRRWSDAYLALTQRGRPNEIVNWLNVQSIPPMLPPYTAGAAKSRLMKMLDDRHSDVELSREEIDKIACWIDLLVPYCGDYAEANAWTEAEMEMYEHFLRKRKRMEQIEKRNIEDLIRTQVARVKSGE